jgi:uncharacterized alkaline shock family protein YloU
MIDLERTELGRVAVAERALAGLVRRAADDLESVRTCRAAHVRADDEGTVEAQLAISAAPGVVLPDLGRHVQERVSSVLEAALGVPPSRVDVTIESVGPAAGDS